MGDARESEVITVLAVDSRHRDTAIYPDDSDYVVLLNNELRNVTRVELVYAIYPTFGSESYVNLYVRELEGGMAVASGSTEGVYGAFTQLPLLDPVNEYSGNRQYRSVARFRVPLLRLARLSIRFVSADGDPYPIQNHFLRFEVTCTARSGARDSDYVQRLTGAEPGPRDRLGMGDVFTEAQLTQSYNLAAARQSMEQRPASDADKLKQRFLTLLGDVRNAHHRRN
jgi:hypothetical protein